MKKIIFTFALIILMIVSSNYLWSQFTVTSAFNPLPGDVERYRECDTTNVLPGSSGTNVNWNNSSLTLQTDSVLINYISPSATPYASYFPTSTIAVQEMSNYRYYMGNTSVLEYLGNVVDFTPPIVYSLSNPQSLFQYPMNYGSSFTDNYFGTETVSTMVIKHYGTVNATIDGYGTLQLPIGTFQNVMRTKYTEHRIDSMWISGVWNETMTTWDTSYYWIRNGYKFGLMVWNVKWIYMVPGNIWSCSKEVLIVPSPSIGVNQISSEIPSGYKLYQNYPNPFNPSTRIRYELPESGNVLLKIYDALGKEIAELVNERQSAGTYEVNWEPDGLSSGAYYYTIKAGDFTSSKTMLLVK